MHVVLIGIFFSSLVVAFSGAMMPGPLLTVTISESTRRGAAAGPILITGHAILEFILIAVLLLGLGPFLKNDFFFIGSALLGGLIMLWMAWGMFRSLPSLTVNVGTETEKKKNLLLTGIFMSFANPYWTIWWATIGIGYIVVSQRFGIAGLIFFFAGHITGDYIWYSAISVAVSRGKSLFTDRIYRILIGVCGAFLAVFAVYLIIMAADAVRLKLI